MAEAKQVLEALDAVLKERRNADPESSYVASLYARGLNRILEKVGEEATEVIIAAKDAQGGHRSGGDEIQRPSWVRSRTCGFIHWCCWHRRTYPRGKSSTRLASRFGLSGHEEKASRGPQT
jgi:phosphoribosyl-ATP pyrophosphohydrolase